VLIDTSIRPPRTPSRSARPGARVLLITEGTYPHVIGGVSSWCDLLIKGLPEINWQVLPIVAASDRDRRSFEVPAHAELLPSIDLWSGEAPPRRRRPGKANAELPSALVRTLIGWNGNHQALVDALVWCRRNPDGVRPAFRSRRGWEQFLHALQDVLDEDNDGSAPAPELDTVEAATLYQTLYWVARTASTPTPQTDLLHVTCAGWASLPALVHKALHGTPILLTEHGVYVRESYLAAARSRSAPGQRFASTRLARGLALATYAAADVISPVSEANAKWAVAMGVDPAKVQVIHNGIGEPDQPTPLPDTATVVAIGRIDPLKDVHTMLRVAVEVLERLPHAQFLYYGPSSPEQEAYAKSCKDLHRQLGLDERFKFMGSTRDVTGALQAADMLLMTSISEGLPMGILEALAQGRPVVATSVGGVPEVLRGCGIVAPPCDVHAIAVATTTVLSDPVLADRLGKRGHQRVARRFTKETCLGGYRDLFTRMTTHLVAT
jgi:glycosyltransferase involved in cell wall biosynthesis